MDTALTIESGRVKIKAVLVVAVAVAVGPTRVTAGYDDERPCWGQEEARRHLKHLASL